MSVIVPLLLGAACAATAGQTPPETDLPASYLLRVERALELCRSDIAAMTPLADAAAARLAGGGKLWVTGQPSMISELSGRAGGFMMIRPLREDPPKPEDVVLYVPEANVAVPSNVQGSQALVIAFGGEDPATDAFPRLSNHANQAGISPTLANAIPGWVFTGEFFAALTRLGKTPVMYESIGLYGGAARIRQFQNGEIAYHDDLAVAPIAPGVLGNRFVDAVAAMLRRIEAEDRPRLEQAGAWAREARGQGKQLFMYSMGHLFPAEIEKTAIGRVFQSAVWNAGFRRHTPPNHSYAPGDLAVHIGYQHPPTLLLQRATSAGARVVYAALYAHRDYPPGTGALWLDPMWDWTDACVTVEGYDIPILPGSGIVNGAMAWEIYRLTCQ